VVYIGTFSKTMFPGLRLGFCVLPERFIGRFLELKWFSDRCVPVLEQLALADWLKTGVFERHVRKMRRIYAGRRNALIQALTRRFGSRVDIHGVPAGMHVLVTFDFPLSESELLERALEHGIKLYPASPCFGGQPTAGTHVILGFGHLDETAIVKGINRLAKSLE
jgi:GntR family transcriptional regulator/MocR family aminotransferase